MNLVMEGEETKEEETRTYIMIRPLRHFISFIPSVPFQRDTILLTTHWRFGVH